MKAAALRPPAGPQENSSPFLVVLLRDDFRVLVLQILTDNLHSSTKEKEKGFQSESTTRGLDSDPDPGPRADPDPSSSCTAMMLLAIKLMLIMWTLWIKYRIWIKLICLVFEK